MAVTHNAAAMPEADKADALIVSVTQSGSVYLGIDPTTPEGLAKNNKISAPDDGRVFLKADGRAPYSRVLPVLEALRTAGITAPVLLTSQPAAPQPGKPVLPRGFEAAVGPPFPTGKDTPVLEVLDAGASEPLLKLDHERIPPASLAGRLRQVLPSQREQAILVRADGALPYAQVVQVIDLCRSVGANVMLLAESPSDAVPLPITGTWRGEINGLPAVLITVKANGGEVSGAISFYFQHRDMGQDAWQVDTTHSMALPLLNPRFDGQTLTFQVSHAEAHPPRTLHDPPSSFQLRLTGKGEAEFENLTERNSPPLRMVRDAK